MTNRHREPVAKYLERSPVHRALTNHSVKTDNNMPPRRTNDTNHTDHKPIIPDWLPDSTRSLSRDVFTLKLYVLERFEETQGANAAAGAAEARYYAKVLETCEVFYRRDPRNENISADKFHIHASSLFWREYCESDLFSSHHEIVLTDAKCAPDQRIPPRLSG